MVWTALALVLVVAGYLGYNYYRVKRTLSEVPKKLGIEIQQSTQGFTFTKSEGGRKQFSISARKAVQFKLGQRAALEDVRIIVYARATRDGPGAAGGPHFDQIYGKEFEYDPASGDVTAKGEVMIDLEHKGQPTADPMQVHAEPGSLHLKTSGLVFNQKTGIAQTKEAIEFSIPQASGSAAGALYDSREMTLTLASKVRIRAETKNSAGPATVLAEHAVISDTPRRAELKTVHVEQAGRQLDSDRVIIHLRDDSTIALIEATAGLQASLPGKGGDTRLLAQRARLEFGARNLLRSALLSGGVDWEEPAAAPAGKAAATEAAGMKGSAGQVAIRFAGQNVISRIRASDNVDFMQTSRGQQTRLLAPAMDLSLRGRQVETAVTEGASSFTLTGGTAQPVTVTADKFEAAFAGGNRLKSVHGAPHARVVFAALAGKPERVTTSREVTAQFRAGNGRSPELVSVQQSGDFHYREGGRTATAGRAEYSPASEALALFDSPRVEDKDYGLALTADSIHMDRKTSAAQAQGNVKTTYTSAKGGGGAMFSASPAEPIHVTSASATASGAGRAHFAGGARLWQGANIIEAPTIDLDRERRSLAASAPPGAAELSSAARVKTVFVQMGRNGKQQPVNLSADRLTYSDVERKARFEGHVAARSADATVEAASLDVFLLAKAPIPSGAGHPGQIDRLVAAGDVQIRQETPARRATGERLVYTASDGKFVLTGKEGKTPSIFDAERGNITGNSLTFFSRDDRVQVNSAENSRTVTRTRVKDEIKP